MSATPRPRRLTLQIDRLVLRGLEPRQGRLIRHELQQALAGLIRERGLPAGIGSRREHGRITADPIRLGQAEPPERTAQRIAVGIYEALDR